MIKFLFTGLMRDRGRSLMPTLVVTLGVMLTVFMYCYLLGVMGDMIEYNANFSTGHVKITTQSYLENIDQKPNDLALINTSELKAELNEMFPDIEWAERISFGGLLDVPDENGETRIQGTVAGMAFDLLSDSKEIERINLKRALQKGNLPTSPNEILISDELADKMDIAIGEPVTLISSTMMGGMAIYNFNVCGTVTFGSSALDRGGIVTDISGIRMALDMDDATSELLGYLDSEVYYDEKAKEVAATFNQKYANSNDPFKPVMIRLQEQSFLAEYLDLVDSMGGLVISLFMIVMAIVLWNTGLIGGLRRYGEVGVRLAMGEGKGHIYRSMIIESILIGIVGSIFGTILGLGFAYLLQEVGIDVSGMMKNSTMMMQSVFRAKITPPAFYIGFIPGIFSIVLGTMLAGVGIYKRKTAQLFKELEH